MAVEPDTARGRYATSSESSALQPSAYRLGDRLCFMHLPKTAGTTLKAFLSDMVDLEKICPAFEHVELEKLRAAGKLRAFDLIQGHFTWSQLPDEIKKEFKFLTFLRHPLPRVISEYYQWSRRPEFFTSEIKASLLQNHNAQTLMLSPLAQGPTGPSIEEHLAATKEQLERYLFVGVQEQFTAGMQALALLFERPMPAEVIRLNVGRNKQETIPGRSTDEILNSNWADLALYEFATELYARKFAPGQVPAPGEYQSHGRHRLGSRVRTIAYRMNACLIGDGWYEREGMGSEAPQLWRWTGPGTSSYVDLPLLEAGRDYRITVRILNVVSGEVLQGLRVTVNGTVIPLSEVEPSWWERFRRTPPLGGWLLGGRVPRAALSNDRDYVRVSLSLPTVTRQCDADPNATLERPIGVAITEINLRPA